MPDFSRTIFRTAKRENPYVQIDKTVLNDERLSWKAKGLMAFLLSKPDDWEINIANLIKQSKDGKESVYSTITELIQYGYIVRNTTRNRGRFARIEYLIFEVPQLGQPSNGCCLAEKSPKTQPTATKTPHPGKPDTVKPDMVFPDTENPPLLINDFRLKNDLNNIPPSISPQETTGGSEGTADLKILEPVALKLFGQSNREILENLRACIKEFNPDSEVVKECLDHMDAKEVKFNPYGYFRVKYTVAIGIITKRMQISEKQQQMEELIKEQYLLPVPEDTGKSTTEIIAGIRKKLGISEDKGFKEPTHEPN